MTSTPTTEPQPQSAAAPSPFPPIAEYAFLSNCHTGALVAPDGAIDWLCVPAFDSPSIFGSLLDRQAGFFRVGPYGINHPGRAQLRAGHQHAGDHLEDAGGLDRRPRRADDGPAGTRTTITPHTRPPADDDADHMLVRTVECLDGSVEVELVCEPVFDYGRDEASWTMADGEATPPTQAAPGTPCASPPTCRLASKAAACEHATC